MQFHGILAAPSPPCQQNPQTRITTFYPQAATRNTAAEMFRIVWLSVSGDYAHILIHLSLGKQSYRINFEDKVTAYNQIHSDLESQVTKKRRLASLQAQTRTIRHIDFLRADISSRATYSQEDCQQTLADRRVFKTLK